MRMPRLEQWDIIEVQWDDAHGGGDEWTKLTPEHLKLASIVSVGQFFAKSEEAICLVLSRDTGPNREYVDAYLTVPLVNVRTVRKLA